MRKDFVSSIRRSWRFRFGSRFLRPGVAHVTNGSHKYHREQHGYAKQGSEQDISTHIYIPTAESEVVQMRSYINTRTVPNEHCTLAMEEHN